MARNLTFLLLSLAAISCGGDDAKKPKSPTDVNKPTDNTQKVDAGTTNVVEHAELDGAAKDAYARGWAAWSAADLPGAKAAFSEAAQKDTKSPAPHYAIGAVSEALGEKSAAQQEFRSAFTLKPDFDVASCAYAMSLARGGHPGEAETFLNDRHAKTPDAVKITVCLAETRSMQNDSATAQQLAQSALKIDPDFKDAMVTIARDHYRARRMDLAKYALQAILEGFGESSPARDRGNPEALLLRGLINRESGARREAMADFEAAAAKRPDLVEALIQAGSMKLEAGNAQEAFPLLDRAAKFAPQNPLAHLNLGDAYRLTGKPTEAKREFDQALSQDSTIAVAHYDLGLLYLFTPNFPGATPDSQVASAIKEFESYKTMNAGKSKDDVDELLNRAKAKQAELKNAAAAAAPASSAK